MAKISVSLEDDLAMALRHEAAGNVSQFVARAVQEALARARMVRALDELDDELGPVDPSVQEEVDELFAHVAELGRSRSGRRSGKPAPRMGKKAGKAKSSSSGS